MICLIAIIKLHKSQLWCYPIHSNVASCVVIIPTGVYNLTVVSSMQYLTHKNMSAAWFIIRIPNHQQIDDVRKHRNHHLAYTAHAISSLCDVAVLFTFSKSHWMMDYHGEFKQSSRKSNDNVSLLLDCTLNLGGINMHEFDLIWHNVNPSNCDDRTICLIIILYRTYCSY